MVSVLVPCFSRYTCRSYPICIISNACEVSPVSFRCCHLHALISHPIKIIDEQIVLLLNYFTLDCDIYWHLFGLFNHYCFVFSVLIIRPCMYLLGLYYSL